MQCVGGNPLETPSIRRLVANLRHCKLGYIPCTGTASAPADNSHVPCVGIVTSTNLNLRVCAGKNRMLELHIWGPAFGLPSIDAECLATIHYLRCAISDHAWSLVPSNQPNSNPFHRLSALRHDTLWVAGFQEIIKYLKESVSDSKDLDAGLNDAQQADCHAYTSFLYSRGIPLLDLSLFVSSDNYTTCTRSVLGDLLSWPQSWTIPHQLRDRAKRRSEHLGLSALDVDTSQSEEHHNAGLASKIPKSLRKPKQTVSAILGQSVQRTRFRLNAVTDDFLEPIQTKLTGRDWLVSDTVCSVDCLTIAIISLMQITQLPQGWLREALAKKYSTLNSWVLLHASNTYGLVTSENPNIDEHANNDPLPWKAPSLITWRDRGTIAIETVVGSIPLLRKGYERHELPKNTHDGKDPESSRQQKQQVYTKLRGQQRLYSELVLGCICTTSILGYMINFGLLVVPRLWSAKPSRRNFGEAGALLGL